MVGGQSVQVLPARLRHGVPVPVRSVARPRPVRLGRKLCRLFGMRFWRRTRGGVRAPRDPSRYRDESAAGRRESSRGPCRNGRGGHRSFEVVAGLARVPDALELPLPFRRQRTARRLRCIVGPRPGILHFWHIGHRIRILTTYFVCTLCMMDGV